MKTRGHLAMTKLSNAARDLLIVMPRTRRKLSLSMLGFSSAVVAKCRELWECLAGGGTALPRPANDYFRWSYEFSCTTTPVNGPAAKKGGHRRRQRRLPPCVGGKQAREMVASVAPRDEGWSPEAGGEHDIDGRAEEFISRFHEQLRMQRAAELQVARRRQGRSLIWRARAAGDDVIGG